MGYLEKTLLDGERVVYRSRVHWGIFLLPITMAVLAAVGFAGTVILPPLLWAGAAFLGLALVTLIAPLLRYLSTEFAVTTKRVIVKRGILRVRTTETFLSKIEGIDVDQVLLGRIFGFGTVAVTGTGGSRDEFGLISDPVAFRKAAQQQIAEAIGGKG